MNWQTDKRIGLVLGGGVARGMVHVGVLEVLEGQGVPIDLIVGVSAGALVGSLYCSGIRGEALREMAGTMRWRNMLSPLWPSRRGLAVSFQKMEDWLAGTWSKGSFEALDPPFVVVASDLLAGEPVEISCGPLAPAVRASSSVPGFVAPARHEGRVLVDGGITNNLPVSVARRHGMDVVIAVNCFPPPRDVPSSFLWQGLTAITWLLLAAGDDPASADVLVEPDLDQVSFLRMDTDELIERGARAMVAMLPRLRERLDG